MRIIVAGSRDITDRRVVRDAVESSPWAHEITELVCGDCRGVDSVAHDIFVGLVPIRSFPPDWAQHGRAAGPIRNGDMADYAHALIAVMKRGGSCGTLDMISKMKSRGKPTHIVEV